MPRAGLISRAGLTPLQRAWAEFAARADEGRPGNSYSPGILLLARWLPMKPGRTSAQVAASHEAEVGPIGNRLQRMRQYGLVRVDADRRYWPTELGLAFRDLIDREDVA